MARVSTKQRPKPTTVTESRVKRTVPRKPARSRSAPLSRPVGTVTSGAPDKPASAASNVRAGSKSAIVIGLLRSKQGATIAEMMAATGWQAHSVRGFLAGSLRKRHRMSPESTKAEGEERRYRAR